MEFRRTDYWRKRIWQLGFLFGGLVFLLPVGAQIRLEIIVTEGKSSTTCTDGLLSDPDPMWSVDIMNQGWVNFQQRGNCGEEMPYVIFDQTFDCPLDVPQLIPVCYRSFENDPGILAAPCAVEPSCLEEICQNFPLPTTGVGQYELPLQEGRTSGGNVIFEVRLTGTVPNVNDLICQAVDVGTLRAGESIGNANVGNYNNECATNLTDPDVLAMGGSWRNEAGVWFTFQTAADVGAFAQITGKSDPENSGDPIDLEFALFASDNNSCNGNLTLLYERRNPQNRDVDMNLGCQLQPNQRYFLLIDGSENDLDLRYGTFGFSIQDLNITEGADAKCDALALGTVPSGSSITPNTPIANFCASSFGDPIVPGLRIRQAVWFTFQPPSTGHVTIEAIPNDLETIDLELVLFRPVGEDCNSTLEQLAASNGGALEEELELSCLDPNQTYYVLVNGGPSNYQGIFDLTISDAGDDRPRVTKQIELCAGSNYSIPAAGKVYTESGIYIDTIPRQNRFECDSIITTELTIGAPLKITISEHLPATDEGRSDAQITAEASGGIGNLTFAWSDGQTTPTASNLTGGATACLTITDDIGCTKDTCLTVDFRRPLAISSRVTQPNCQGENTGIISFSIQNGEAPYAYTWTNPATSNGGQGQIAAENETVELSNLIAGEYKIRVRDNFFDSTFSVKVGEPEELEIVTGDLGQPTCYKICDGNIQVLPKGGTGPYRLAWSDGLDRGMRTALCAGTYSVTLTNAKGCSTTETYVLAEAPEFTLSVDRKEEVSCFQGSDGAVEVVANQPTNTWQWSTGASTPQLQGLSAGSYEITATNESNCAATLRVEITEPSAPLEVNLSVQQAITCHEGQDGILNTTVKGPYEALNYNWSQGGNEAIATNLKSGTYQVTVTNERGCTAWDSLTISAPTLLLSEAFSLPETCLDNGADGTIAVETTSGGVAPYVYALENENYQNSGAFGGLTEGYYQLRTRDALGCVRTDEILVEGPFPLEVSLGEPKMVRLGEQIALTAEATSKNVTYEWLTDIPYTCEDSSDCQTIRLQPLFSSEVQVRVVERQTQCSDASSVDVLVDKERMLFGPTAFSPNNDGKNDFFQLFGKADIRRVLQLQIFDRYGNLVFSVADFPLDSETGLWAGTRGTSPMNTGVYVWRASVEFIDDAVREYGGDVLLVR